MCKSDIFIKKEGKCVLIGKDYEKFMEGVSTKN